MGKHERESRRAPDESRPDRKKHRKHQDDRKKHKKHKDKKSRRHNRQRSGDSDSNAPTPDYARAMDVARELLTETPELAKDLLALLQMLDDGEVAVIGGIENRRIRSKLKELFPLLGLVKLAEPKGAFAKSRKAREEEGESLMQVFQRLLTSSGDQVETTAPAERSLPVAADETEEKRPPPRSSKRDLPIGPALPPGSLSTKVDDADDEENGEVIGPALPGMKGFRVADERVEAEMARQARQLEKEQWERARGGNDKKKTDMDGKAAPLVRQEWMTVMPESSILKDSLGPTNRPPPGKPVAFRSKEPATVDRTWFDSPEERDRAKRAKLDMELLGYVREENAPAAEAAATVQPATARSTVNESILPGANPEADEDMRRQMEQLRQSRGPSLLEQHQRKQAEQSKAGSAKDKCGWNRDRDLTARQGMSGDDAERMIAAAKQVNSKFTAPTISRQFL